MKINLFSLEDLDISKGVNSHLFIRTSSNESRSNKILELQQGVEQEIWHIAPASMLHEETSETKETTTNCSDLKDKLSSWIEQRKNLPIAIYVDISCMSHAAMAAIGRAVFLATEKSKITLSIGYVIANYTPPPTHLPPNEDIKPIDDYFAGWPCDASATTSLILGLGYEREKAEGACEYFDASDTWVFFPKSSIAEYDTAVRDNNSALLERLTLKDRALHYQVSSPSRTFGQLAGLITSISYRSNPVFLPFGPKIFFMLSLIISALYREVGIWHITGDSISGIKTESASDQLIGFEAKLGPAEEKIPLKPDKPQV